MEIKRNSKRLTDLESITEGDTSSRSTIPCIGQQYFETNLVDALGAVI